MANLAEAMEHNTRMRKAGNKKPELRSLEISEAENGGHAVEHRFTSGDGPYHEPEMHVFSKHAGAKPKIPKGHVLEHIAKAMHIEHESMGGGEKDESANPAAE